MHASIRRYRIDPKGLPKLKEIGHDAAKTLGAIPGCKAYYLVAAGDNTVVSVTICDNAGTAGKSNEAAAKWVGANLPGVIQGAPEIIAGELIAQK